ncbi:MAG TPA: protein phosphatase 2C domain-containing protein [Acidimicrobiales bacterium]|nr:protein phosphatase 2C domain-containing protein [Acidimicrobiales bacterium]
MPLRTEARSTDAAYRADGGVSPVFSVLAASVAGASHRLAGRPCEDAYGWDVLGPGAIALLLADGVGAASRGGEAAELAVSAAARYLIEASHPDRAGGRTSWTAYGDAVRGAVLAADVAVEAAGGLSAGLATTLVVAVLTYPAGVSSAHAQLARVGDSTAFVLSGREHGEQPGEWREAFSAVEQGGGAGDNVTNVVPLGRARAQEIEQVPAEVPVGAALVLVSDGIANPLRDGPATVAPALATVLAGRDQLSPLSLARAIDFSRRGALDDRALVIAWPKVPPS